VTRAEKDELHGRMIECVRKNPDQPLSILCQRFGVKRESLLYVIQTKAADVYAQRRRKK
jgi:hypothetical protein